LSIRRFVHTEGPPTFLSNGDEELFFLGVKRPEHDDRHLPVFSAEG
jgi:hypothetical protein